MKTDFFNKKNNFYQKKFQTNTTLYSFHLNSASYQWDSPLKVLNAYHLTFLTYATNYS